LGARETKSRLLAIAVCVALAGCTSGGVPPVSDRSRATGLARAPGEYVVVAGDTLYSIAWRHQRDFRTIANLNGIKKPYDIFPGQRLRMRGAAAAPTGPTTSTRKSVVKPIDRSGKMSGTPHPLSTTQTKPQTKPQTKFEKQTQNPSRPRPPAKKEAAAKQPSQQVARTGPVNLSWPSNGKRLRGFGVQPEGAQMPSRSIDFLLQPGASIRAAAAGEVVYVGRGLAGFEQFVIVKHNDTWLSAYGFNSVASVREKQRLAKNAVLARVAGDRSGRPAAERERQLHFEVRKDGKPVNPASVIK